MSRLELKIPPLALVLISAAAMWFIAKKMPAPSFAFPGRVFVAIFLAALGVSVALAGVIAFRRARTTVNPTTPETTSSIVRSGIYRRTRNPMYLGFLLLLCGWAAWLANLPALGVLPLFVLYLDRFQIVPEERALRARFGGDYERYATAVRRWL